MSRSLSVWACLMAPVAMLAVFRLNAGSIGLWIDRPEGAAMFSILAWAPYLLFGLCVVWAARIANTPVFVLSILLITAHGYFSGAGLLGRLVGDQLTFVLFLLVPVYVALASMVSHRTMACTIRCGFAVAAMGLILPPLLSAAAGRRLLDWTGEHRWFAASVLGAPSGPAIYYLAVLALLILWPRAGREGEMKKITTALMPCYYFCGVFSPVYASGPIFPQKLDPAVFAAFSALAGAIALYANGFLSWTKAYTDDLTQVMGRRALNESITHLSGEYSIAMVDIDHFKKFNDTHGHAAGDAVLKHVAAILNDQSVGRVYRYGGEEFSIVFPDIDAESAAEVVDEIRRTIADSPVSLNGAARRKREKKVAVRISAGVAQSSDQTESAEDVVRAADRALYKAKENGRNRVELA